MNLSAYELFIQCLKSGSIALLTSLIEVIAKNMGVVACDVAMVRVGVMPVLHALPVILACWSPLPIAGRLSVEGYKRNFRGTLLHVM